MRARAAQSRARRPAPRRSHRAVCVVSQLCRTGFAKKNFKKARLEQQGANDPDYYRKVEFSLASYDPALCEPCAEVW